MPTLELGTYRFSQQPSLDNLNLFIFPLFNKHQVGLSLIIMSLFYIK